MQQVFSDTPPAPTPRMGHMVRLHKAQSILTVGPTRDADPRDYSILRLDMPHRDNANPDAPHKTYSSQAFLSPHYLTWTASPGVVAGPFLTLQDWQSWFCQCPGHRSPSLGSLRWPDLLMPSAAPRHRPPPHLPTALRQLAERSRAPPLGHR